MVSCVSGLDAQMISYEHGNGASSSIKDRALIVQLTLYGFL
jgi:hypothetical protein